MSRRLSRRDTPHPALALTEPSRAIAEIALLAGSRRWLRRLPKGDGHSVIVIPGFLSADGYNSALINYLIDRGYRADGWGQGRNMGPSPEREAAMLERLDREFEVSGRPVSLVGHSLGGLYARELAKLRPEQVRQVISLGTPFQHPEDAQEPPIARLFRYFNPDMAVLEENRAAMGIAPPVPTTAVFTAGDGIVHWTQCIQNRSDSQVQNIRVAGSHAGLTMNPSVWMVVADRLAQAEGEWKRFKRSGLKRLVMPRTDRTLRRADFDTAEEARL